jgi:hypothetical protein
MKNFIVILTFFFLTLLSIGYWKYAEHLQKIEKSNNEIIDKLEKKYNSNIVTDGKLDFATDNLTQKFTIYNLQINTYGVRKQKIYLSFLNEENKDISENLLQNEFDRIIRNENSEFETNYISNSKNFIINFPLDSDKSDYHFIEKDTQERNKIKEIFAAGYFKLKIDTEDFKISTDKEKISKDYFNVIFITIFFTLMLTTCFTILYMILSRLMKKTTDNM